MKKFIVLLLLSTVCGCTVIGPGERGVRISLGKVSTEPKVPGAYVWIPFLLGMASMDVQIQKSEVESTGATKDMQDVHAKVAVNWSLAPENVVSTYQTVGNEYEIEKRILAPAINEVMKSSTAKRNAEEVLTKRMEMKNDIDEALKERLKQYGITLHDVSIVDLSFSEGFTQAIEAKQIAEQQSKQAAYEADKATQQAKAEVERAKGQAEAQRLIKTTITEELLKQKAIDKWDGHFPQVMGQGTVPFINLKM